MSDGELSISEEVKLAARFVDLQDTSSKRNLKNNNNRQQQGKKRNNGFSRGK
jgi:hypothetical protein